MNALLSIIAASTIFGVQLPAELNTHSEVIQDNYLDPTRTPLLLQVGDTIKDFTITTPLSPAGTEEVALSTLLESGPVVLTFFRGSWCPYCRGELSAIQDNLEKFEALGATVLAISPEMDKKSIELGSELELGFYIGHDENNELARKLGLTFKLDAQTIKKYKNYDINVPKANGTRTWELPIPATYVIDQDSTVKFVFDDKNYSKRANYKKVLKVIKEITTED